MINATLLFLPHFSRAELKDLRYFLCNQHIWRHVCERFADVNVVDRVAHVGDGVMVWYRQAYGQRTQVHVIDRILNAQRYRDEILRPIVVPFIHDHHLMLQHDNARPHVARICTQFLEAENITVLAWPAYSCHPLSMLWIGVYDSMFQFLAISSNFTQPLKRSGPTFHNQQPDQLYVKEMCCTAWGIWWPHQILNGFRTPQYSKTTHFRVAFYCGQPKAHLCNNHAVYSLSAQCHRFRPLTRFRFVNNICLRSLSSAHEKWGQKQKCCVYNFVQYSKECYFRCSLSFQNKLIE